MNARVSRFVIGLVALGFLVSLHVMDAGAQTPPCGSASAPMCDGECSAGLACVDNFGSGVCVCVPVSGQPCGVTRGAPECWGGCPPAQACVDAGGVCECQVVPALSEWGILGMSLAMFGSVWLLRGRRS